MNEDCDTAEKLDASVISCLPHGVYAALHKLHLVPNTLKFLFAPYVNIGIYSISG